MNLVPIANVVANRVGKLIVADVITENRCEIEISYFTTQSF